MKPKQILLLSTALILSVYFLFQTQPVKEVTQVKTVHDTIIRLSDNPEQTDSLNDYKQALQTCVALIKKKNYQIKTLKAQLNESTTTDDSSNFGNDYTEFLSKRYQK